MSNADPAAPDWAALRVDLTCPLCGYSLRGLTEPRCPECGFAFSWAELLDERRDRHPWLVEHARPGRRARAFVATYWRSAFPRRFWRSVTPANPVRLGRLLAYWAVANAVLAGVLLVPLVQLTIYLGRADLATRATYTPSPGQPGRYVEPPPRFANVSGFNVFPRASGTVSAAQLDQIAPRVPSADFAVQVWTTWRETWDSRNGTLSLVAPAVAVALAWPWLSVAALTVFAASMRRAKVSPAHVLRTVVYSCDVGLLIVSSAVVLYGLPIVDGQPLAFRLPTGPLRYTAVPGVLTAIACTLVCGYRLAVAHARYLRVDRPGLTVVAAQTMVVLTVAVVLLRTVRLF